MHHIRHNDYSCQVWEQDITSMSMQISFKYQRNQENKNSINS